MGDVLCACRITGPDQPGPLLCHVGLTGRHTIVKPNWFSLSPANDSDATVLDPAPAVLEGRVAVLEACTAMRHRGGTGITPRDHRSLCELWWPQSRRLSEPTGIGAVLECYRATHIRTTDEVWPHRRRPPTRWPLPPRGRAAGRWRRGATSRGGGPGER